MWSDGQGDDSRIPKLGSDFAGQRQPSELPWGLQLPLMSVCRRIALTCQPNLFARSTRAFVPDIEPEPRMNATFGFASRALFFAGRSTAGTGGHTGS